MTKYTDKQIEMFNKELKKMKKKVKKIINHKYFDSCKLSDMQYNTLKKIANAETHDDISSGIWGLLDRALDTIEIRLKTCKYF